MYVVWWKFTNVLEVLAASIVRTRGPDDGGNKNLWNVGKLVPDYKARQPSRRPSSYSSPWEPQISQSLVSTF
jgi:hypothetical protein